MLDPASLILSCLFSLVGLAFFVYGKKASDFDFLIAGVLLMAYPLFVSGTWLTLLIGLPLTAAPFLHRRFGV
jgi:hypothetical protein